jgi:large subunit ribosomal protein L15
VKLHDLKPAPGSRKPRRRVGRGIAAGQGKTAGRGTKGQKARAGGKIPAWFEGGQTPLHQRLPKLHGFKNPFRVEYEVVNLGAIAALVEAGVLESGEMPGGKKPKGGAPITVNQEILRATGLVRTLDKPLKILGGGDLSSALFVVADAFSASARSKIEAAGGSVNVLEVPRGKKAALKAEAAAVEAAAVEAPAAEAPAAEAPVAEAPEEAPVETPAAVAEPPDAASETPAPAAAPAKAPRAAKSPKAPKAEAAQADQEPAQATAEAAPAPKTRARRKPATDAADTDEG